MAIFVCIDHDGVWLGGTSVVVANDEIEARKLLDAELVANSLKPFAAHPYTMREISAHEPRAFVLDNGDY